MTYRGAKATFYRNFLNTEVRFGSIASSSLNHKVAEEFGTVSCFEIYTCEGADITKYSRYPDEKEVLIPPYEMFKSLLSGQEEIRNISGVKLCSL